jgi:hypothetical protein
MHHGRWKLFVVKGECRADFAACIVLGKRLDDVVHLRCIVV